MKQHYEQWDGTPAAIESQPSELFSTTPFSPESTPVMEVLVPYGNRFVAAVMF